jgi:UDP-N-acetylmuramyl pentapeptide synthase
MGANHQKEIEMLCGICQPDFGYITNFGKAHLGGLFGGGLTLLGIFVNNKLIDRATRYISEILDQKNHSKSYEVIVEEIFKQIDQLQENEPIVLKVVEALSKNN